MQKQKPQHKTALEIIVQAVQLALPCVARGE